MARPPAILPNSLALAARLLAKPAVALAFAGGNDPLAINLPPLGANGTGGQAIDRPTVEVMATLYFQAELEQAGVIPVAEVLADARFQLQVTDATAANLLESFASQMQSGWYPRPLREQLFARTFGLGPAATVDAGMAVNREFEQRMAQLCTALDRYQQDARWAPATTGTVVQVEIATDGLLQNLAHRRFGNTLAAAQKIQEQLAAAITLLNHPGLGGLFQARSLWDLVRNILGPDTPDLSRIVARAQAGIRLLDWLGAHLAAIQGGNIAQALANSTEPFLLAANWLQATGLARQPAPQPGYGPGGYGSPDYVQPGAGNQGPGAYGDQSYGAPQYGAPVYGTAGAGGQGSWR